jgi:hypothetical protein
VIAVRLDQLAPLANLAHLVTQAHLVLLVTLVNLVTPVKPELQAPLVNPVTLVQLAQPVTMVLMVLTVLMVPTARLRSLESLFSTHLVLRPVLRNLLAATQRSPLLVVVSLKASLFRWQLRKVALTSSSLAQRAERTTQQPLVTRTVRLNSPLTSKVGMLVCTRLS